MKKRVIKIPTHVKFACFFFLLILIPNITHLFKPPNWINRQLVKTPKGGGLKREYCICTCQF